MVNNYVAVADIQQTRPSRIPIPYHRQRSTPVTASASRDVQTTSTVTAGTQMHSSRSRVERNPSRIRAASIHDPLAANKSTSRNSTATRPTTTPRDDMNRLSQHQLYRSPQQTRVLTRQAAVNHPPATGRRRGAIPHQEVGGIPIPDVPIVNHTQLFREMASHIGKWRMVGRYLNIDDLFINEFEQKCESSYERTFRLLCWWFDSSNDINPATYTTLAYALLCTGQTHVVEDFRSRFMHDLYRQK